MRPIRIVLSSINRLFGPAADYYLASPKDMIRAITTSPGLKLLNSSTLSLSTARTFASSRPHVERRSFPHHPAKEKDVNNINNQNLMDVHARM